MGAVTGAESGVKDWWGRDKGAGHTGVRNLGRNIWQGAKNVAADYLDATQGVKTPEQIVERQGARRQGVLDRRIEAMQERLAAMGGGQPPVEEEPAEEAPAEETPPAGDDAQTPSTTEQQVEVPTEPVSTAGLRLPQTPEPGQQASGPFEDEELMEGLMDEEPVAEGPGYAGFNPEQYGALPSGAQKRWLKVEPDLQQKVYDAMARSAWNPELAGVPHWKRGSWEAGRRAMGVDKSQPFDAAWRLLRGA